MATAVRTEKLKEKNKISQLKDTKREKGGTTTEIALYSWLAYDIIIRHDYNEKYVET